MIKGDTGCLDRASSAANETAQWAVSQSEDCLSESGYPVAPPQEDLQLSLPSKLVANLPYAVAATVVLDYFESFPFLDSATIMVQKEVADRMAAAVGQSRARKVLIPVNQCGNFVVGVPAGATTAQLAALAVEAILRPGAGDAKT